MSAGAKSRNALAMYNRDAEMSVLGSVLIDGTALAFARGILTAEDFGDASLAAIYRAMCDLADGGSVIDPVTLSDKLLARGVAEDTVGKMIESIAACPTAVHVEQYANIVADLSARRRLIKFCSDTMAASMDENRKASEIIGDTALQLRSIMERGASSMVHVSTAVDEYVNLLDVRINNPDSLWGVPTSLVDLDKSTNGLQAGMTILGGLTHHGKTALGVQIASHAAAKGIGVVWFSLEMTRQQMVERFACHRAKLSADVMSKDRYSNADELARLYKACAEVRELPIYFYTKSGLDQGRMYAELTKLRMKHNIGLCVIDHLHLMRPPKMDNIFMAYGAMAQYIHQVGLDENLPMLTLAQLNRGVNNRDTQIPQPSDIRNSGEIEQVASVILFVHRPEVIYTNSWQQCPAEWKDIAAISIAKNRLTGKLGVIKTRFVKQWGEFQCLSADEEPPF